VVVNPEKTKLVNTLQGEAFGSVPITCETLIQRH
jgi:hypothetical protein